MARKFKSMDGNNAAAYVSYAYTEVAGIYPITPSSPMADLVDTEKEKARLTAELARLDGEIERVERKLANEGFVAKAPAAVVEGERAKLAKYQENRAGVAAALAKLK